MPLIPLNYIIMWDGTHASIPSGWSRETTLDDTFIKGTADAVNPDVTGGAATHTHTTDASHTHTLASHSHTGTTNYVEAAMGGGGSYQNNTAHSHTYTTGAQSATSGTGTPSWDSPSSEPAHFEPIYIKSDGTPNGFPQDSQVLANDSTLPPGWIQHVASKGVFLKGASTASGNGGGTGGGSHTHTGTSHNHTFPTHLHGTATTSIHNVFAQWIDWGWQHAVKTRFHTATPATDGNGTAGNTAPTNDSEANEPAYFTLWMLDNTSAGTNYLENVIVMYLGTIASVDAAWRICDGTNDTPDLRDEFIKIATNSGDIGDTGGAQGHTHTGGSHTHTSTGHTHSVSIDTGSGREDGSFGSSVVTGDHDHTSSASDSTDPGLSGTTMTTDSTTDTQPPFRTVLYLMSPEIPPTNAPFFGMAF